MARPDQHHGPACEDAASPPSATAFTLARLFTWAASTAALSGIDVSDANLAFFASRACLAATTPGIAAILRGSVPGVISSVAKNGNHCVPTGTT